MSDQKIEALEQKIAQADGEAKAHLLLELADILDDQGIVDKAIEHLETALPLAEKNDQLLAKVYYEISGYYYQKEQVETAVETAQKSVDLFKNSTNKESYIKSLRRAAVMYAYLEKMDTSDTLFNEALEQSKAIEAPQQLGLTHILMGDVYTFKEKFSLAISSYQEAIKQFEQVPEEDNTKRTGHACQSIANILTHHKKEEEALQYYNLATEKFEQLDAHQQISMCQLQVARVCEQFGRSEAAATAYAKAADAHGHLQQDLEAATTYHSAGYMYQQEKNWSEALKYFQKALPFAETAEDEMQLDIVTDSIEDMQEKIEKFGESSAKSGGGIFGKLKNLFGG